MSTPDRHTDLDARPRAGGTAEEGRLHGGGRDDVGRDDLAPGRRGRDDLGREDLAGLDGGAADAGRSGTAGDGAPFDDPRPGGTRSAGTTRDTAAPAPGPTGDDGGRERLVSVDRAESYTSRWDEVKGMFVDEPRQAVTQADSLVGELLDELEHLFREQRQRLEHGLDADETSTEDLRIALRRYRSFFDRLLSL